MFIVQFEACRQVFRPGEFLLVVIELPPCTDHAAAVHDQHRSFQVGVVQACTPHFTRDLPRNAETGRASAVDQNPFVRNTAPGDAAGCQHAGQCHCAGALDIVVK